MADPALNLKVNVTGAQQGAAALDQVAKGTDKVTQAAGKSAPAQTAAANAAKGLGESLSALGSRNNDAKDVLEGVSAAAKGGEGALFGIAKAARAAFAVFASGPIGIAVAGLALIGTAAFALKDKLGAPKKSAEELAEELAKSAQAAELLNKVKMESLKLEVDAIDQSAKKAATSFELLQKKAQAIDDAEEALQLAEIANNKSLTDEARLVEENATRARFADRRRGREVGADQFSLEQSVKRNTALQNVESGAARELQLEEARLQSLKDSLEIAEGRRRVEREGGISGFLADARFEKTKAQLEPQIEQAQKNRDAAEQRLIEVNVKAKQSVEDRLAAEEKFRVTQETRAAIKPLEEKRQTLETQKAREGAKQSDKERQKQIDELGRKAEQAAQRGDFAVQDEAVFERNKLLRKTAPSRPGAAEKVDTIAPKERPGDEFIRGTQPLPTKNLINRGSDFSGEEAKTFSSGGNRINIGSDFKEAADKVKAQPPADLEPVAEASRELADAVIAQAQATQESVNETGSKLLAKAGEIPNPPSLDPILEGVTAVATTLKAGQDVLRQDVDRISQGLRILAQQIAAKRS